MTKKQASEQVSQPIRQGDGYVIDDYRPGTNAAFRSHIMSWEGANEYRRDLIAEIMADDPR